LIFASPLAVFASPQTLLLGGAFANIVIALLHGLFFFPFRVINHSIDRSTVPARHRRKSSAARAAVAAAAVAASGSSS
jgi:hypothetical protein